MTPRLPPAPSFLDACLLKLVLPVGMVHPSEVLLAVSASFLLAFSLTFSIQAFSAPTRLVSEFQFIPSRPIASQALELPAPARVQRVLAER